MFENAIEEPPELEDHLREMVAEALIVLRKRGSLAGEVMLGIEVAGCKPVELGPGLQIPDHQCGVDHQCAAIQHCFKKPTDSPSAIIQPLVKMLGEIMQPGMEVSGVKVVFSDLTPGTVSQLCLIGDGERKNRLDRTIELINGRFGDGSLCFASTVSPAGRAGVIRRIAA